MKRKVFEVFGFLLLVLGITCGYGAQPKKLTILHTNDTHSCLLPLDTGESRDDSYAGIARMATLIKKYRAADDNVLVLNAGDVFVGTFEFNKYLGYPELKIMENLYDAMELGNHEFDLGFGALAGILSGQLGGDGPVTLPLLCANVNFDEPLSDMIKPYLIKTVGGIKVGIFGVVTEDKLNYSDDVARHLSGDVFGVAGQQAAALKAAGCEVVVCLSHLGTDYDLYGLADQVPDIDIIVGGHSHDVFEEAIVRNGKIIVQAGAFGEYLGELKVKIRNGAVSLESWTLHPVSDRIAEDPKIRTLVNRLRDGVVQDPRFGPVYTERIATAERDITKDWPKNSRNRDTALGNLVTDAFKNRISKTGVQVDLALDALGYLATDISEGKVVGNDILRAVPYGYDPDSGLGFKLVVVPLPGSLLLGGLEYAADMVDLTTDLSIQASGLRYRYDSSQPPAANLGELSRVDPSSVKVNGVLVDAEKFYMVAMTEQIYNFLNGLVAPMGITLPCSPTGLFEYTAVRDYMKSLKKVSSISEGRIKDTARR